MAENERHHPKNIAFMLTGEVSSNAVKNTQVEPYECPVGLSIPAVQRYCLQRELVQALQFLRENLRDCGDGVYDFEITISPKR